ncbi:hypothetical protein FB451DRAFT_1221744 [Mycena latifolia]|nr:hypothetical protein FB451DRAFT_1221744 [Mycena latifolia]
MRVTALWLMSSSSFCWRADSIASKMDTLKSVTSPRHSLMDSESRPRLCAYFFQAMYFMWMALVCKFDTAYLSLRAPRAASHMNRGSLVHSSTAMVDRRIVIHKVRAGDEQCDDQRNVAHDVIGNKWDEHQGYEGQDLGEDVVHGATEGRAISKALNTYRPNFAIKQW